jgi:hypothetical protein
MSKFKQELLTRFQGTDEGEVKEYLVCELIRDRADRTGKMVQACGNAFFHQTTNTAGKIEPDNWPVVRLDFPGCISSPMEKRVPTKQDMLSVHCVLLECGIAILCSLLWTQMYV